MRECSSCSSCVFFYVWRHRSVDKLQFVCTYMWALYFSSLSLSRSAFLPRFQSAASSRPSFPPRITRQICKNTLLISRQKWQLPSMTSAPCIPSHPIPPSPSFHFHFSFPVVHLRHKYSLTAPPLCSRRSLLPPPRPRWHITHTVHCKRTVTHADMDSISCLVRPHTGYIQERSATYAIAPPMLSDTESLWVFVGPLARRQQNDRKQKINLSLLLNPEPPAASGSLSKSLSPGPDPPPPRSIQVQAFVWFWW